MRPVAVRFKALKLIQLARRGVTHHLEHGFEIVVIALEFFSKHGMAFHKAHNSLNPIPGVLVQIVEANLVACKR